MNQSSSELELLETRRVWPNRSGLKQDVLRNPIICTVLSAYRWQESVVAVEA
jgi:hypothetical protein